MLYGVITGIYVQIAQEILMLVFTWIKILFIHIHVHTNNARPQQWPHALCNKLQVFYENSIGIYRYSTGFRTPAVDQSY